MAEADDNIVKLLQTVEQFYKDISLLMQTADSLVQKHGLIPEDSKCFQIISALDAPSRWQPIVFFRYYKYSRQKTWLPFISVILGDPERAMLLPRPLMSAGWYEFIKSRDWYYDFAAAHLWVKNAKEDGTAAVMRPNKDWEGDPEQLLPGP